ncbi:MAG: hypothetical protein ACLFU5_07295 [Thermoplasmata archaeon]
MQQKSYDVCPVCESTIPEGEEKCPECGLLIGKFDFDVDVENDVPKKSIERVKELLMEEGDEGLVEIIEDLEIPGEEVEEEEVEEIVTFACPICDAEVEENDTECPNCGAIFEVEEESEEEEVSEEEVSESIDIEEELDFYQTRVAVYENSGLDMEYIKEDIDEFKEAAEQGDGKRCDRISQKIEENLDHAEDISECSKRVEHYLEALSEKTDTSPMEKELSKVYEGCEIGEYLIASKKASDVLDEAEKRLQQKIEEEWLEEFIEKKSERVREKLRDVEESIDIDNINDGFDRAISLKNQGRMVEGVHQIFEVLEAVSVLSDISEAVEESRGLIHKVKDDDLTAEYTQELEEKLEVIELGQEVEVKRGIKELVQDIEDHLEQEEKEEMEEKRKRIEEKISKIRSLQEKAEEFEIEIDESKLEAVVEHKDEENIEEALSLSEELKKELIGKIEVKTDEMIDEMKEKVGEYIFDKEFQQDKVKELLDEGEANEAVSLIKEYKDRIEDKRENKQRLLDQISKTDKIIKDAEDGDFEIEDVKKSLERARESVSEGRFDEAEDHIQTCEKKLHLKLVKFLQGEIKNAKQKLKGISKKDIDVKKIIDYLKKANQAKKEKELEKGFETLKNYKEEMERISEP